MTLRTSFAASHRAGLRPVAALFAFILFACNDSAPLATVIRSDALTLAVTLEPTTARTGNNDLKFELQDPDGVPISGAEISTRIHMHAMGGMPAMGGAASVTPEGQGRYRANFDLKMGGTWLIEIRLQSPSGDSLAADGSLTVGIPGLSLQTRNAAPVRPAAHTASSNHPAQIQLDPARLRHIGVRVTEATLEASATSIRTPGRITYDETTLRDVSLKVVGWVGEIRANAVGAHVRKGEELFRLYSPELLAAQEEYLQALRSQKRASTTSTPDRADYLVRAARTRLRLWDIAPRELDAIARSDKAREFIPVRAPTSGYIIEKNVVEGSSVAAGAKLYRIAPIDRVWVEAEIYESDFPLVTAGQAASITLPYLPGETFEGAVSYVYPYLEAETRTGRIRIELENPGLTLRPDMYANVTLAVERPARLLVPASAVLHAGERAFVFVELLDPAGADRRFEPRAVQVGSHTGDNIEIVAGLSAGDPVVTSGTFLIASESRLRAAMEDW
jgi:Cu(I)/Ag(I) efflux system membrane fusion protein